jgi:hypothetical protein
MFLASLLIFSATNAQAQFAPVAMWKNKVGYLVKTSAIYKGNFGGAGGLSGANSSCVTDLQTNNWLGKTNAPAISSTTVRAFLCDNTSCQNLQPNKLYQFAVSGSLTAGGALFATDATGAGPGDTNLWTGLTYLNGAAAYFWSGRAAGTSIYWSNSSAGTGNNCNNWTASTGGNSGLIGDPGIAGTNRWSDTLQACNSSEFLLCMVDPPP